MQNLRNKFLQFFFVLAVILLIGCNGGAFWLTGDRYVARVNEDTITEHDFRKKLEGFHTVKDIGEKMKIDIASVDYYKILNDMIDDRLIVQEAIKMDFNRTPEFTGDYNLFKLNLSLYMLKKEEIIDKIRVTDEEMQKRYIALYESVKLRHLFTRDQKKGERIIEAIRGGVDFISLVEKESEDSEEIKKKGGELGFKRKDELPKEIADAAFAMKEGEISGLLRIENGFHIIRLEERKMPEGEIPEGYRKRIERLIFSEKEKERNKEYLTQLREKTKITIDGDALKTIESGGEFDGGKRVVATVEGESIRRDEILVKLRSGPAVKTEDEMDKLKRTAIDSLINQKLLDLEVVRKNYEQNQGFKYSLSITRDAILNKLFRNRIIASAVRLDDEEIKKYYEDNRESFKEPDQIRINTIQIKAKEKADRIIDELKRGADFDVVAADVSGIPVGSTIGNTGWLYANILPPVIKERLNEMNIGGVYGPFDIDGEFLIIKLLGREDGKLKSFETVKNGIVEQLSKKKYDQLLSDYLAKLRASSKIKINESAIKGFIKRSRQEKI
jgi:peptidyl-prolyl cis-trans isomerase C